MNKPFSTLRKKMSAKAQKSADVRTRQLLDEMLLQKLRQALDISQETLAKKLLTKQTNISQIERRKDMYISTLRSLIEAMGGELDIVARFPQGDVHLPQFSNNKKEKKHFAK